MNTTLALVVSAIVILITALVVITIFSNMIQNFGTIAQARSTCQTIYTTSCSAFGQAPADWTTAKYKVGDDPTLKSCQSIITSCNCPTPATGQAHVAVCT
jgi:hypothetical protein